MALYLAFITLSSVLTDSQISAIRPFYVGFLKQLSTLSTYDMSDFKNYLNY